MNIVIQDIEDKKESLWLRICQKYIVNTPHEFLCSVWAILAYCMELIVLDISSYFGDEWVKAAWLGFKWKEGGNKQERK